MIIENELRSQTRSVDMVYEGEVKDYEAVVNIQEGADKCCDPYDGKQEAYEKSLVESYGFQTQDNLAYFLDIVLKQYLILKYNYHAGIEDADKLSLIDKLSEAFKKSITYNTIVNDENIDIILQDVCDFISSELSHTVAFYSSLAQLILDRTIDVSDSAENKALNVAYKVEYIKQLSEMFLPNMLEDMRIYFNSDDIDSVLLQDVIENIGIEQPDAIKYRIIKMTDKSYYSIILTNEEREFIPVEYKLTITSTEDKVSHTLTSHNVTNDEITALLDLYVDIDRWLILIEK